MSINIDQDEHIATLLPVPVTETTAVVVVEAVETGDSEIQDDFTLARGTLRNLITQGGDALEGMLTLAKDSEHPRAYEVLSTLINTLSSTSKDLLELHQRKQDLVASDDYEPQQQTNHIENAVFVGTTNDLADLVKRKTIE